MRVALDVAREAIRRGSLKVTVVSLESEAEMPAMKSVQGREETEISEHEGVAFQPSWGPRRIIAENGKVKALELMRCVRVFDDDGRFRPQFDENQLLTIEADSVILAIGQAPDLSFLKPEDGVELTPAGTIKIDPATLATTAPGVYAGGDGAFPPSILITVAYQGKVAARSIDAYLRGVPALATELHVTIEELPTDTYRRVEGYEQIKRHIEVNPLSRRSGITEVESSYSAEQAREQGERCLYCHIHPIYDGTKCVRCNRCVDICPDFCLKFVPTERLAEPERFENVAAPGVGETVAFLYDEAKCIRCGLCAIRCPTGAITMEKFYFDEERAA
jgi:NADPH-dependent glutamate synthase beta subunit-like oxidoreductase